MTSNESHLTDALATAGAKGLSRTKIRELAKVPESKLDACLKDWRSRGLIHGPFSNGKAQYYFDGANAPSCRTAEARIEEILRHSGAKLVSRTSLDGQLKGVLKPFFADALSSLKSDSKILELKYGSSLLYAHREPVLELLRVDEGVAPKQRTAALTLSDIRPAYETLKAQQGGISVVKIFDLLKATGVGRDELHALLREEARLGRVSLHPATTAHYSFEVVEAGIKIDGERDPRVTVVFKEGI
jgi:hypothetical protein